MKQILNENECEILMALWESWRGRCFRRVPKRKYVGVWTPYSKGRHNYDWHDFYYQQTRQLYLKYNLDYNQCALCFKSKDILLHHISYFPEITINICKSCHMIIGKNKEFFNSYIQYNMTEYHLFYEKPIPVLRIVQNHPTLTKLMRKPRRMRNNIRSNLEDPRHQLTVRNRGYF